MQPSEGFWATVRDSFFLLRPASFSIFIALLAIPVFFYIDQGLEILRSLGEGNQYNGKLEAGKVIWFVAALLVWAVNSWYWARVNLNLRNSRSLPASKLNKQPFAFILKRGPRLLGLAPLLIVGIACIVTACGYPHFLTQVAAQRLLAYATTLFLLTALLYGFFRVRRKTLERRGVKSTWKDEDEHRSARLRELPAGTKTAVLVMLVLLVGVFVLFLRSPVVAPKNMGSAAILALAGAFWVCLGSFAIALTNSSNFPIISFLVGLFVVSSCVNDNHAVRLLNTNATGRLTISEALQKWKSVIVNEFGQQERYPLFIVTAEGGGIRAAYWTATVLGTIQETALEANADFASHVFAISGVSGGSLGAAVFNAEVAEGSRPEALGSAQDMLGEDFLSPALAAMLYRDFLQRFLFWKVKRWDRGRALEMAWEDGWRKKVNPLSNRFEQGLNELFSTHPMLPALFLNATSVEAGRRVIVSNLSFNSPRTAPDFIDSVDAISELNGKDMRLSTAAHMSARFTYVSPAGLFPDGQHVVDGGYFENSGETTVRDLLHLIARDSDDRFVPIVIEIANAPGVTEPTTTMPKPAGEFLSDVISPLYALLHTREARGTYSQMLVRQGENRGTEVIRFSLKRGNVPLPLGWMLSGGAASEMKKQINDTDTTNPAKVALVVDRLLHPGTLTQQAATENQ